MPKPRRAFHELGHARQVSLDVDLPGIDDLNIHETVQVRPSRRNTLRALDPLAPNSQANAVPSMPLERLQAQNNASTFYTVENAIPPLAGTVYDVVDQGIADPHVVRLSMYNIPNTEQLRAKTKLPLGLIATPFAFEAPVSDFSQCPDAPRCDRCRAYVNPATQFKNGGSDFVCALCQFTSRTPEWYYQPTEATQRRVDAHERPELACGVYDFILPEKYAIDGHTGTIILIDVSRDSQNKGLPSLICEILTELCDTPPECPQICIMTFSSRLHVYRPEMLVVDPEDPVIPPDAWLSIEDAKKVLAGLPSWHPDWEQHSVLGGALKALLSIKFGRVAVFAASMPNLGPSKLVKRDAASFTTRGEQGGPEPELFLVNNEYYKGLAKSYKDLGTGISLFLFPSGYTDVATLSYLCKETGGNFNYFPRFSQQRDSLALRADIFAELEPTTYSHCATKVRCSLGLQVVESSNPCAMDANTVLDALIRHDSTLPSSDAYFQIATLYSTRDGERRVRIANIPAGVTDTFKNVLRFIDSDAIAGILTRQVLQKLHTSTLEELRQGIHSKLCDIFGSCRAYAGGPLPPTQLLMPTSLRPLLPLINGLVKTTVLSPRGFSVDGRVANAFQLAHASPAQLSSLLYPQIWDIENGLAPLEAKKDSLSSCALFYNGTLTLWVAQNVSPVLLKDLFGVDTREEISPYMSQLPEVDTQLNVSVRELISSLGAYVPLQIAREGLDGSEYQVAGMLIEDSQQYQSYGDMLQAVHNEARRIAEKLENARNWL